MELLVIKPSSLGDIVHGLQIVQAIVDRNPEIRVTWVVRDRFAPLVEAAPFVQRVIPFRRRDGWRAFWELLKEIRSSGFDCVFDLQGLLRSGLMTAAAKAPEKWGRPDAREGAVLFYKKRVARPAGEGPHHAIEVLLPFAQRFSVDGLENFELRLKPAKPFPWQDFFSDGASKTLLMFPDSRGPKKEWPYFNELLHLAFAELPDIRVAWCAGKPTDPSVSVPEGRFLNLTGCPLDEMMALVRQPSTFVGNDSGPMHLAAAVGNPVLAIFGPTPPRRFGPWPLTDPRHRAVVAPQGNLRELAPEAVVSELKTLLGTL